MTPEKKKKSLKAPMLVVGFIITLVGGLYLGAEKYRASANKAACTVTLNSLEKGIHSYI